MTGRMRGFGHVAHCSGAHAGVGRSANIQVIMSGKLPRNVVVRFAVVLRIVLCGKQIHRVVSIGLVQANNIGSDRIIPIGQVQRRRRLVDLDFLAQKPRDQCRHAARITLRAWNQVSIRSLIQTLAPRMQALLVEVAQQ